MFRSIDLCHYYSNTRPLGEKMIPKFKMIKDGGLRVTIQNYNQSVAFDSLSCAGIYCVCTNTGLVLENFQISSSGTITIKPPLETVLEKVNKILTVLCQEVPLPVLE